MLRSRSRITFRTFFEATLLGVLNNPANQKFDPEVLAIYVGEIALAAYNRYLVLYEEIRNQQDIKDGFDK